jgi:uncharacterized protein
VDGMPYSVFTLSAGEKIKAPAKLGRIRLDRARELIHAMKGASSTVLELAATIYWLVKKEKVADWKTELVRRKGVKTQKGRMDEAVGLLDRLGMSVV